MRATLADGAVRFFEMALELTGEQLARAPLLAGASASGESGGQAEPPPRPKALRGARSHLSRDLTVWVATWWRPCLRRLFLCSEKNRSLLRLRRMRRTGLFCAICESAHVATSAARQQLQERQQHTKKAQAPGGSSLHVSSRDLVALHDAAEEARDPAARRPLAELAGADREADERR